jgi:acyl-coenzyme A synthetase/AMP-(fatty) acid ligase
VVPDGPPDAGALMAWVAERVALYQKVRAVGFAAGIPGSPSGKVLRRVLRDRGWKPASRVAAAR